MSDTDPAAALCATVDRPGTSVREDRRRIYIVGGGIASMAAAAFMIRDGDVVGNDITIFEALPVAGGSLDGSGSAEKGYVLRGGRMLESKYVCTLGLFDSIPTLDGRDTVTAETLRWNETMKTSSKSRLFRGGRRQTAPELGLSELHILTIEGLALEPEALLGSSTIQDRFEPSFFRTDFWLMWCSTFAFQPWHGAVEFRRYLLRFAHMIVGFERLEGIMRTVYNQYDSMVRPLRKWLEERGVGFEMNARVYDLGFEERGGTKFVKSITYHRPGWAGEIEVLPADEVLVTLGSMTESSSLGSMDAPALLNDSRGASWALWDRIADGRPEFGRPSAFDGDLDRSKWVSFTTTLADPTFLRLVRDLTGNVPGEGGLITFADSAWLLSIVVPHQPHFIDQPDGVDVLWGYGLSVDAPGDFVAKPMSACSGREIMTEILGHLGLPGEAPLVLRACICIPCMMPYITSQFLPRKKGDRPEVLPRGWANLAFMGQFCEIPDEVVFTVEYSIRSAQMAAYGLLGLRRKPPPVYQGRFDPRVLFSAFLALHDIRPVAAHA